MLLFIIGGCYKQVSWLQSKGSIGTGASNLILLPVLLGTNAPPRDGSMVDDTTIILVAIFSTQRS